MAAGATGSSASAHQLHSIWVTQLRQQAAIVYLNRNTVKTNSDTLLCSFQQLNKYLKENGFECGAENVAEWQLSDGISGSWRWGSPADSERLLWSDLKEYRLLLFLLCSCLPLSFSLEFSARSLTHTRCFQVEASVWGQSPWRFHPSPECFFFFFLPWVLLRKPLLFA